MAARKTTPLKELEMHFAAAASPHRVLIAVRFLASIMDTFRSTTNEDGVTLVVSNYALSATLRAQNAAGASAIAIIEKVLRTPSKALRDAGLTALDVAETIVDRGEALSPFSPSFRSNGKPFRDLTGVYLKELDRVAKAYLPPKTLRGTTVVHSPILRIGRARARAALMARILVGGRPYDLPVDATLFATAWEIARSDREAALTIDAVWGVEGDRHILLPKRARIVGIDPGWDPGIGAAVADELRASLGEDAFADMDDVMGQLGIDRDVH